MCNIHFLHINLIAINATITRHVLYDINDLQLAGIYKNTYDCDKYYLFIARVYFKYTLLIYTCPKFYKH